MKNLLRDIRRSPRFMTGFLIFLFILLVSILYPLLSPGDPLAMIGRGTFAAPGTYVSLYDATSAKTETLLLPDADDNRLAAAMSDADRAAMINYFTLSGVAIDDLDPQDTDRMIELWQDIFDETNMPKMTNAQRRDFRNLDKRLKELQASDTLYVMDMGEDGEYEQRGSVSKTDYVNASAVANAKTLLLGTDNFGRDTLRELIYATGTSLLVGLVAGIVATLIGLSLGLLAGYMGGIADDVIMFVTNLFTVIPGFVLLILISSSVSQDMRGPSLVAVIIGLTSWPWTTRSVRAQVVSLRNRDHVNLSKLSGHSMLRIVLSDILPYVASYVVMAFILQVSSGILAEAQLSMLGLGPKTTTTPTLGLMMNWAMLYSAHTNGSWWAYFPVILTITLISFSLNLMNTGLDQVFNPTLRD